MTRRLSGTAEYQWAQGYGDPESQTNFGNPPPAPVLGQLAASLINNGAPSDNQAEQASANELAYTANYMDWYWTYAIGRVAELGFAAKPLALYTDDYLIGLINSQYPELIADYTMPSWLTTGQITSFPALIASMATPFLTGVNYTGGDTQGALPQQFSASLYAQGYDAYALGALSMAVDQGAPGAAAAEAWMQTHVRQLIGGATAPEGTGIGLAADPSWAIAPRTDKNALPAQPTAP